MASNDESRSYGDKYIFPYFDDIPFDFKAERYKLGRYISLIVMFVMSYISHPQRHTNLPIRTELFIARNALDFRSYSDNASRTVWTSPLLLWKAD